MTIITCKYCNTPGLAMCKTKQGWRVYERLPNPDLVSYRWGPQHKCDAYYKAKPKSQPIVKPNEFVCNETDCSAKDNYHVKHCPNHWLKGKT